MKNKKLSLAKLNELLPARRRARWTDEATILFDTLPTQRGISLEWDPTDPNDARPWSESGHVGIWEGDADNDTPADKALDAELLRIAEEATKYKGE